jgi:hypothetical protein
MNMIEKTAEKRSAPRFKVLKGGTIAFNGSGQPCTVRNLSSTGAAIDLVNAANLPPSFTLIIEADDFIRRCHPVWSNETRVGVAFD